MERLKRRHRAARVYRSLRQHSAIPIVESRETNEDQIPGKGDGMLWVSYDPLGERFEPLMIVIRSQTSVVAKLRAVLHQLGHLYCHYPPTGRLVESPLQQDIEADAFAAMAWQSFKLGELNEQTTWIVWQATKGRYPDTVVVVTGAFDHFWRSVGREIKH